MIDGNDDYFREEPWRNPIARRSMVNAKIEELAHALTCAMTRIYQARDMGVDVTDARFEEMVAKALNMEGDYE